MNFDKVLTGTEKAAAFILALSEENTNKVISLLDESEIKDLSLAMSQLGNINASNIEIIFQEFLSKVSEVGGLVGTIDSTERLLGKLLSKDQVDTIMEDIRGPLGKNIWEKMDNIHEEYLASYLKSESPQTIAVILSKLKPDQSARVLGLLPDKQATDVLMRMIKIEPIQKDILQEVENTLRSEFISHLGRTSKKDAHDMIAEIFNYFERNTEQKFMHALEEKNPESAEKIKTLMFTFEDLKRISDSGIQRLIREIDKNKLALALKGASEETKALFFKNLSERAEKLLLDDMNDLGKVRLRDVDDAQSYIINKAKDLSQVGDIVLLNDNQEDELIG
jgi:flagellar motor switch protein FliG